MIITWEGRDYTLDLSDFTLRQAEAIEAEAGMPLDEWLATIEQGTKSLTMIKILYWLMLAQNANGQPVPPIGSVDFKLIAFSRAFADAQGTGAETAAEEAEPDPTLVSPSTPTSPPPTEIPAQEPPPPATGGG